MRHTPNKDTALPNVVVAIDADNTLWDTNTIFANAQLNLLKLLEVDINCFAKGDKLGFIRSIDQELAQLHGYDLRYPPHILVRATINALMGLPPKDAARMAIDDQDANDSNLRKFTALFLDDLKTEIPKLRPGVRSGLAELCNHNYQIVIVTESNHRRCGKFLEEHKLDKYITCIYEVKKSIDAYKKLSNDFPNTKAKVMIGDQIDRDIIPAKNAEFFTIYFPGGFKPTWTLEQESQCFDQQITSFAQVPDIISRYLSLDSSHQ